MRIDDHISRRSFLALAGGAVLIARGAQADSDFPALLDHFILGCDDLDRGIDFVEQRTGVRAAFGGVHPGRGTRNALLSLGARKYLEIMAPDPAQQATPQIPRLRELKEPRLEGWAAHPGDLEKFSAHLREADIPFEGPRTGSRQRPDGKVLHWKSLTLKDDQGGLLPFFIEWSADSIHPSADAPQGCRLARFGAVSVSPDALKRIADLLQLDMPVSPGAKAALGATIVGPKGDLTLTS
jgi:Glyoxalase-like domain